MNKNELLQKLNALDRTNFIYKGELYDTTMKDWTHNSLGYIPDLVSLIADYAGMEDVDELYLLDYIQDDLISDCMTCEQYAAAVKFELLDHTDLI